MALANWQSIGIFGYPLGEIRFKWIFSDTVTLQWHTSGSNDMALANWHSINMKFISRVGTSVVSLYRGKQPRSQPLR